MSRGGGIVHWGGNYGGREKAREPHSALTILSASLCSTGVTHIASLEHGEEASIPSHSL